ncbi:MAG: HAMP domain-containing sensor histidine kinase [Bacteroidota bacterium]
MSIQNLIIGNQQIKSEPQRRKIILGGYLILIYIGMGLFYFIVNLFNPDGEPTSLFIGFIVSIVCLVLLRSGYTEFAIVIHFIRANFIAFYFSIIDDNVLLTGTYIYFVPASLGALAVYGYTERWKGIGFASISFALFLYALLQPDKFSLADAHFYFIMNFFIVFIIGALIVIFFDKMVLTAEQKIQNKNAELVKVNSELDRFVYSASHDLRAPLSSLLGLINISKLSTGQDESKQYLEMMESRVLHLDSFIKEIIDYSRNSRLQVRTDKVNLRNLVKDVIDSLRFSEHASQIKIEILVSPDSHVTTDTNRLKVVLTNLVSNSISYADFTKKIPLIQIEAIANDVETKILVKDNGLGVAEEHRDKIFDMFYRASDNSKGSGLGLYIVAETLERINGSIELNSELGKGTTVTVALPST